MTVTLTRPSGTRRAGGRKGTPKLAGVILILVTLAATGGYIAWRYTSSSPTLHGQPSLDLQQSGTLLFVDASGTVRQTRVNDPAATIGAGPTCQRVHTAARTLVCLRAAANGLTSDIFIYHGDQLKKEFSEWGLPSRARVSPSGNLVSWTLFRTGDSYLRVGQFATTAGIYHLGTGAHHGSLEDFTITVDNQPYTSPDVNFWGVTFAADDRTFYATMASKGRIWLVAGDLTTRSVRTLRNNIECPSLSPDGTRIAYKHRTGDHWRLHVFNLATGTDIALAEPANVDDQPAWLDNTTIAYTRNHQNKPTIFTVPADGTGHPQPLITAASSPAIVTQP